MNRRGSLLAMLSRLCLAMLRSLMLNLSILLISFAVALHKVESLVLVKTLLHQRQIEPYPSKVILAYKEWQPLYDEMKEQGLVQVFVPGLDDVMNHVDGVTPSLLILDDLQQEVAKNDFVSSMFMRGSHHRNCSCIFIVQNLYFQGKKARDIALNAHYYVIFRNPGDQLQIQNFARRRGQYKMIMNAYKDYCSQKHSFIIIDNSQHTDDRIKIGMPVTDLVEEH